MGVVYTPESEYAKELVKFEQHVTPLTMAVGKPPGNPYVYRPFPAMLYKMRRRDDGVPMIIDPQNEAWSAGNYMTVNDERELSRAVEAGWRPSVKEAEEFFHSRERATSNAAAERAYTDARMSEPARREAAVAEAETHEQLPEIPEKKRRGRPRKAQTPAA